MKEVALEELKKIELKLFSYFLEICEKENLQYYLLGGSCLGAVRHKGFIPWDDDIDVGMPRTDYELFLKLAQDELPDGVFLQTYKTDPGYINNFAKLRDCNTTFIESSCKNLKMNHGIYLDIFPLDGAADSKEFGIRQLRKINWYTRPIAERFYHLNELKTQKIKSMAKKIIYPLVFPSVEKCLEKREKLYREFNYKDSLYVANYGGAWGAREIVPKEYFGKGCIAEFEGIKVYVPENYGAYLTEMYGDYMTPPPPEKRIAHHYCEVIDVEKSYKEYV